MVSASSRTAPCDLCAQRQFELVAVQDRRGQPLRTVICRTCGLLSHEAIPSEQELADYYARQYRADYHGEYRPSAHRVLREWRRSGRLVGLLAPHLTATDRILDLGCGIGCTVKQLQIAHYDAAGIEPGDGFRQFAQQTLGACVQAGSLADVPRRAAYDVVLLNHVLEHFRSPRAALEHVRAVLRPAGRLYVEVPNAAVPYASAAKMFHFAHIYNFTADTLQMLAERCGFRLTAWLQTDTDRNLRAIFRGVEPRPWQPAPGSYERTRNTLDRHSCWAYYVRGRYLRERLGNMVTHTCQRIGSRRRLDQILAQTRRRNEP